MSFKVWARKFLRLVYTLAKWILALLGFLIFATLAYMLISQTLLENSIENGMTRQEVIEELGEPRLEQENLGICTGGTWLGDCEAALRSGAVIFLHWKYGVDTYFIIGFDKDDRVVFHGMGDA